MKKFIIAILVIVFVSTASISAQCLSAEENPFDLSYIDYKGDKLTVDANQGDTVEIVTVVKKASLANGLLVNMYYDSNLLAYVDAQKTNLGRSLVNTDTDNRIAWSIMFSANGTNIDADTEVNVLRFTARSDISSDTECFSYMIEEFYDSSSNELPHSDIEVFCRVNGSRIINIKPVLYGDANNDGKVTNADALSIVRHAIKASVLPQDRIFRCDINSDGKVTNADALQITRWCIGYKSKYPIGEKVS